MHDSANRPPQEPRQPHVHGQVEPDDEVGVAEIEVAELAVIAAVDDPCVALDDRLDRARSSSGGVSVQPGCQ